MSSLQTILKIVSINKIDYTYYDTDSPNKELSICDIIELAFSFGKKNCKVIAIPIGTVRFRLEQNVNSGFFSCEFLGTDVKYYGESGRPSAGLIDCE